MQDAAAAALAGDGAVLAAGPYVLSPLQQADAADVLRIFGDPAVVAFMDIPPVADLTEARAMVDWAVSRRAQGLAARWGVRATGGGPLLGTCGFNLLELDRGRRGEIAYDLAREHWGKGVMSQILPHLIRFGFERLGLGRLEALVTTGNFASCRLLERHGFLREGLLRDHGFWKGRYWDQALYARLASPDPAQARPMAIPPPGLRRLTPSDAPAVLALQRAVATAGGGLARRPREITAAYVEAALVRAAANGVALGAYGEDGALRGEIHAVRPGPAQFDHVLSDLTVAVHPACQGQGLGARLFEGLFAEAARLAPPIRRIELMVREGSSGAVGLYRRLGFRLEGRFEGRVRLPDGSIEADLAMARPL